MPGVLTIEQLGTQPLAFGHLLLAEGGTGVPSMRRLCACWGGGTGVLDTRLSSARIRALQRSRACCGSKRWENAV